MNDDDGSNQETLGAQSFQGFQGFLNPDIFAADRAVNDGQTIIGTYIFKIAV